MHSGGYRQLTRMMMDVADEVCEGRLVLCHEGGYSRATVPFYGLAVMETLSGIETGVEDPFLDMMSGFAGQDLQSHQKLVIDEVIAKADILK